MQRWQFIILTHFFKKTMSIIQQKQSPSIFLYTNGTPSLAFIKGWVGGWILLATSFLVVPQTVWGAAVGAACNVTSAIGGLPQTGVCDKDPSCTTVGNSTISLGQGNCDTGLHCCGDATAGGTPTSKSTTDSVTFKNPLSVDTLMDVGGKKGLVSILLDSILSVIPILVLLMFVIGATLYVMGDIAGMATVGKKMMTYALIGLALGVATPSFIKEVYTAFGTIAPDSINASPGLTGIAKNFLTFFLSIVGLLAVIMLVAGGIMYITAGDSKRVDTATSMIKNAVIGLVLVMLSLVIVRVIAGLFA